MSELKDPEIKVDPPRVTVSLGYKANLGNYENTNLSISVSASAVPGEKAGEAVDRVYALVEQKLLDRFNDLKKEMEEAGLGKE